VSIGMAPVRPVFAIRTGMSVNISVIADSSLSKLLYFPSKELSDSSESRFFERDYHDHDQFSELLIVR